MTALAAKAKRPAMPDFVDLFFRESTEILTKLSREDVERLAHALADLRTRGGRLFVLGSGGSAGNASHAVNDFRKLCGIEAYAPTDNVSELSARTNDEGWHTTFSEWLKVSKASDKDAVIVFSVGGGNVERNVSPNIVEGLKVAKARGLKIFGIVGRDGGIHQAGRRRGRHDTHRCRRTRDPSFGGVPGRYLALSGLASGSATERDEVVKRRAAFLDRDGVLNRVIVRDGRPYPPATLAEFELYEGVPETVDRLRAAGFAIVIATNQPDAAEGRQSRVVVDAMHDRLTQAIRPDAIKVAWTRDPARYKPSPGMLLEAASEIGIDLTGSFMVGDRWRDVDCGKAAGCRTIFIDRGYSESLNESPDHVCADLASAVDWILNQTRGSGF